MKITGIVWRSAGYLSKAAMVGEWRDWKEFWRLSRRDRVGLGSIALLIVLVLLAPDLPRPAPLLAAGADSSWVDEWNRYFDSVDAAVSAEAVVSRPDRPAVRQAMLFFFDPNTLDSAGWKKLGLRERTIQTILRYRARGGRFRRADDLSRIYGLFPDEVARLTPYVTIAAPSSETRESGSSFKKDSGFRQPERSVWPVRKQVVAININEADSLQWISLPGIGPVLSSRILRFRESLGGFVRIDQVAETFGLADSSFRKISPFLLLPADSRVRQLSINSLSEVELSRHPYVSRSLARRLLAYRTEHGPYKSMDELRNVIGVDTLLLKRLALYLQFE